MEEFPWSRAAKIVGADESRAVARKKAEQRQKGQLEKGDGEKREKKTEADNDKKGK